jgi:hypothetical protein
MWAVVSGIIVLLAASFGARPVGRALKRRSFPWYVAANVLVILAAASLVALAVMAGSSNAGSSDVLYGAALGLGFGYPAGLRHGYKGPIGVGAAKNGS